MDECRPTGEERWSGDWEYVGAAPTKVVTPHGPVQAGVAMTVTYVWRRPFERQFVCCEGEREVTLWVAGNWAYWTFDRFDAGEPVRTVDVPIPGKIADALGASLLAGVWWEDPAGVDGMRPAGPDSGDAGNQPENLSDPPRAECGELVQLPDGERILWDELEHDGEEPPDGPPVDAGPVVLHPWPPTEDDCCAPLDVAERRPRIHMPEFPRLELHPDGTLRHTGRFAIHHECELEGRPRIEIGVLRRNPAPDGGPPLEDVIWWPEPRRLYTGRFTDDHKRYEVEFTGHAIRDPAPAARDLRLHLRIEAYSKCRGRLFMELRGPRVRRVGGTLQPGCLGAVLPRGLRRWLRRL